MPDNARSSEPALLRALTCLRADHPAHTPVPCDAVLEREHGRVLVRLADGIELDFDERELLSAIGDAMSDAGRLRAA